MGLSDQTPVLQGGTDNTDIGNILDTLKISVHDAAGTAITSTLNSGKQSLDTNITGGTLTTTITSQGSVTGGTAGTTSMLAGGQYNSTLPTLTTTQQVALQVDSNGRLITANAPLPSTNAKFSFGDVATSATTANVAVRRTTYTEQTSNAQRSIASASANDTSAGTGARTVIITYLDSTGAGPYTETVTLNGTSYVNTVATNICFIEHIKVATVGSTGSNVGILTLKAATAGGGATIGTINAADNQTFWAHHYTPLGKTTYISGFSVNSSSTVTGAGAVFILRAQNLTSSNSPNIQVSDFNRLYGQASSTNTRTYLSPIQIPGPARITAHTTPESSTSITQRASFDYIDN
jgi:hypothetical protein